MIIVSITVLRGFSAHFEDRPWSAGVLVLPGAGGLTHEFSMPVFGTLRVFLQPVTDGSAEVIEGDVFYESSCRTTPQKPETNIVEQQEKPLSYAETVNLVDDNLSRRYCVLFGRYGVVRFELRNATDNVLLRTRHSPIMYPIAKNNGTGVAEFRQIAKGTELKLIVTSFLSDSLKQRERKPYELIIDPVNTRVQN